MGSKIEYVESSHMYVTNYVRNYRAVGVLWGMFTICYAIIIVVAFVTPEWIGETSLSENPGRFGLWVRCVYRLNLDLNVNGIGVEECIGQFDDFSNIPGFAFKVASVLVAVAVLGALLTICALLLFFFVATEKVFKTCGWIQLLSAIFLIAGTVTYPAGWDAEEVQQVCGSSSKFELGDCSVRWAFLLAVYGCFDALILSLLAFILSAKHVKLQPDLGLSQNGQMFKGEVNGSFLGDNQSLTGSRKSLNMHPVLMMPQPVEVDRFSEFSNRTGRTKSSAYRANYASSIQNFQL